MSLNFSIELDSVHVICSSKVLIKSLIEENDIFTKTNFYILFYERAP